MKSIKHFIDERLKLKSEIYDESVCLITYGIDKFLHPIPLVSLKRTKTLRQRFGIVDNRAKRRTEQEGSRFGTLQQEVFQKYVAEKVL